MAKVLCFLRDDHSALNGLKDWLVSQGHELVIVKDLDSTEARDHLPAAQILIIQPCLSQVISADNLARATALDLILTMNIELSDNCFSAAIDRGVTIVELYGSIDIKARGTIQHMLALIPQGMAGRRVGICPMGQLGQALLPLLKPYGVELHYSDAHRLPDNIENDLGLTWHAGMKDLLAGIDILLFTKPRPDEKGHWYAKHQVCFDHLLGVVKPGSRIVNTDSVKPADRDYICAAAGSGHLAGYASHEWISPVKIQGQPWRAGAWQSMTTILLDQIQKILEHWFRDRCLPDNTLSLSQEMLSAVPAAPWNVIYNPSESGEYPTETEKKWKKTKECI